MRLTTHVHRHRHKLAVPWHPTTQAPSTTEPPVKAIGCPAQLRALPVPAVWTSIGDHRVHLLTKYHHRHCLPSLDLLSYESDVANPAKKGRLLVDDPKHCHNISLWVQLLRFKQRVHRKDGVLVIWRALCERRVMLTCQYDAANILWKEFVTVALSDQSMLEELLEHCRYVIQGGGTVWRYMYETIIIHYLKTEPSLVFRWHHRLKGVCPFPPDALARIWRACPGATLIFGLLNTIYKDALQRDLYSVGVPLLCSRGEYRAAYRWHRICMWNADPPKTLGPAKPLVNYLARWGNPRDYTRVLQDLRDANVALEKDSAEILKVEPSISREIQNTILGGIFRPSEKPANDGFCARLFATKAFSLDTIINGMVMLGLDRLGPLSLLELVRRIGTAKGVQERIEQMAQAGISVGSSRFALLVRKFASTGQDKELQAMLLTDQHPDELDNTELQERLLADYLERRNWTQVRRTLSVLVALRRDSRQEGYNLILRCHIRRGNIAGLKQTLNQMHEAGIKVTHRSTLFIVQNVLRPRKKTGHLPLAIPGHDDDLGLVIGMLKRILQAGNSLDPLRWNEPFRRLGQAGRLDELERLALWLASFYSPKEAAGNSVLVEPNLTNLALAARAQQVPTEVPTSHIRHPMRVIFNKGLQKNIIAWGFISALCKETKTSFASERRLPVKPWTRGLLLIKALEEKGVYVMLSSIRGALLQRLTILYGLDPSDYHRSLRLRRENTVPFLEMMRDIEEVWGPTLFNKISVRREILSRRRLPTRLMQQQLTHRRVL